MFEMVNYPAAMIREGFEDQNVVNFDVSENVTIFELENGEHWWAGKNMAYKPEKVLIEESKIKLFAAGDRSFCLVSDSNNVLLT